VIKDIHYLVLADKKEDRDTCSLIDTLAIMFCQLKKSSVIGLNLNNCLRD